MNIVIPKGKNFKCEITIEAEDGRQILPSDIIELSIIEKNDDFKKLVSVEGVLDGIDQNGLSAKYVFAINGDDTAGAYVQVGEPEDNMPFLSLYYGILRRYEDDNGTKYVTAVIDTLGIIFEPGA